MSHITPLTRKAGRFLVELAAAEASYSFRAIQSLACGASLEYSRTAKEKPLPPAHDGQHEISVVIKCQAVVTAGERR